MNGWPATKRCRSGPGRVEFHSRSYRACVHQIGRAFAPSLDNLTMSLGGIVVIGSLFEIERVSPRECPGWVLRLDRECIMAKGNHCNHCTLGSMGSTRVLTEAGPVRSRCAAWTLLVKYDFSGNAQWERTLGTDVIGSDFSSVAVDSAGNLYAAGYLSGNPGALDLGNGVTVTKSDTSANALLVKYDFSGTTQWARLVTAGASDSRFNSVVVVEQSVFLLLLEGLALKEIAAVLGSSHSTVRTHCLHIREKTAQRSDRAVVADFSRYLIRKTSG